jgi:two-component system OmpR family response regulator
MASVLLLEDEITQRRFIAEFLTSQGHLVVEADCVRDFDALKTMPDIAIIDIKLPDGSGFEVVRRFRKIRPRGGIIMLSDHHSIDDQITALRGGADQYLVKPINLDEFSACITALVRLIKAPGWLLNVAERRLAAPSGHVETLNALEIALIELLARNASGVVYRKKIAAAFGADWHDYDERHLDQLVSRLRRRWRQRSGEELPLRTEFGQGYSFCVNIEVQ